MLDEFSATKADEKKPPTSAPPLIDPLKVTAPATEGDEVDFEKHLQAGMSELLGQFQSNPEMQAEFEKMMKDLSLAAAAEGAEADDAVPTQPDITKTMPTAKDTDNQSKKAKSEEDSFQETIRKTMERMQASGDTASAAAASSNEDDMLAQMLKEMEKGNFPGMEGQGGEEDFNKMLMGMMEQLTHKEILYEPMKELHDKYPAWLESNKDTIKPQDLSRYKEQQTLVNEIVGRFERKGYSDDNQQDRDYIVERMQKVCKRQWLVLQYSY